MKETGGVKQGRVRVAQRVGGGVLLAWCLVAAVSALLAAMRQPRDPTARIEASFAPLLAVLPAPGEIGYLEGRTGSDAEVRAYYVAQYALVPHVIVSRVGPEFLIVAAGTEQPGGDERLEGYALVIDLPNGHRLFRRRAPDQGASRGGGR